MAKKRTAHAYAQALLALAVEPWLKGLRLANRRLRDGHLLEQLQDPGLSPDQKKQLLAPALTGIAPQVAAFVYALADDGDVNKLDTIADEFETLAARRSQYLLAHVRSAVPLTDSERKQLEERLTRRFGDNLEAEYEVDPSLLGGVVVRVGDEVIDGSLAGKLSALRERLA